MKLLILLTIAACLQATAKGFSQTVTLSLTNAPMEQAFKEIKKQTGYSFVYIRAQLKNTLPVNCQIKDAPLKEVLDICFRNQPLSFVVEDHYIVVQTKAVVTEHPVTQLSTIDISGRVINENGEALAGVTITANKSGKATSTNEKGEFSLKGVDDDDVLIITSVGYYREEIEVDKQNNFLIRLRIAVGSLDETIIMAYGKTSRRLSTGDISKVSAEVISSQPVSNPLATLQGRVPGLIVNNTSGFAGASVKVQIRGQNSITQGSEPLFIIDGVSFAANNQAINNLNSILTTNVNIGLSPFNSINPEDIESIEILKDADATAIYGSRGANGVILITTKKGKSGKPAVTANVYTGWSKVSRTVNMLDTKGYLQMRKEAFANDGIIPSANSSSPGYAPDIMIWDTSRYTDFKKIMIGNTASTGDYHLSVTAGNQNIQILLAGGFHHESTVLPGDLADNRGSVNANINYNSANKKFLLNLSSNYSSEKNNLINASISSFLMLPPNSPSLYKADGQLNWDENGIGFDNPLSYLLRKYTAGIENLISHLQMEYKLLPGLTAKISLGYNGMHVDEESLNPIAAQNPAGNPTGTLRLGKSDYNNWIIEPQFEYSNQIGQGKLTMLAGGTWQNNSQKSLFIEASGYTGDDLLKSLAGGNISQKNNGFAQYRYQAIFGRINYDLKQKYLLNLTGRRDGSSRFGPGRQYANFGAIGAGWVFSGEDYIHKTLPFLSFGKIKASYGLTGNDQIGDYKFLDAWNIGNNSYQGTPVLYPAGLFNADYGWEVNRKFETALELGFFKDRFFISAAYYNNRCKNQLVQYNLPGQTGFPSINKNFPALVENSGYEMILNGFIIKNPGFSWSSNFNITIPRNKLKAFPGIESSSYSSSYVVGQSLNLIYQLRSAGIDPSSGLFAFDDFDKNGSIQIPNDYEVIGNLDPKFYGGLNNNLSYKGFEADIFFEFKKQTGRNDLWSIYGSNVIPGFINNQPSVVLNRWQKPGDNTNIEKFTSLTTSQAYQASANFRYSSGVFSDASYIRLKTIAVSYSFPAAWMKKIKAGTCKVFIHAQNLLTLTNYNGADPEIQNLFALPTLKTIVVGFQITF